MFVFFQSDITENMYHIDAQTLNMLCQIIIKERGGGGGG